MNYLNEDTAGKGTKMAVQVLERCLTEYGFVASPGLYPEVCARDSMITSLGAAVTGDDRLKEGFERSLLTLAKYQSDLGQIPHFYHTKENWVEYGEAGNVDSNLWYIIGAAVHNIRYHEVEFLKKLYPSLEKALLWLRYQDSNNCGLLEVHEAADWADLFANRFNILYDNILYYAALKSMVYLAETMNKPSELYQHLAADVYYKINLRFWITRGRGEEVQKVKESWKWTYEEMASRLRDHPYYLPYVAFRDYNDYCDVLGNCLAIIFEVADMEKGNRILSYIEGAGVNRPYPCKAFYPPLYPGDKDWRDYYRVYNLNQPHQYHNGGIWPFIGGFYIASLVKAGQMDKAEEEMVLLEKANQLGDKGNWPFGEWMHGVSGKLMGSKDQAWSAGMYLYAKSCLMNKKLVLIDSIF
jgi:glycogen debranching enzyme